MSKLIKKQIRGKFPMAQNVFLINIVCRKMNCMCMRLQESGEQVEYYLMLTRWLVCALGAMALFALQLVSGG